jgi:lipopolysaccharide transport system ATP-binding protein
LKDVSFQVERGEVVGIIGRNGAGKSTLLKILSQITAPTEGRAVINGRVGSLLEVGTGFHQELTGRENIYLNGAILGMTKDEIDRKFDEIVDFSGVEKFIDTPVKHYSSGMRVRLAFSVAAHLDPEILLIDEVLAVGDAAFQKKCLGKMDDVAKSGRTVLFVSHDMGSIQNLCPRAILLEDGNLVSDSETDVVVNRYLQSVNSTFEKRKSISDVPRSSGHGVSLRFTECRILDSNGDETQKLQMGEPISILVKATAQERLNNVSFVIGIDNRKGSRITTAASEEVRKFYNFDEGEDIELIACFEDLLLNTGQYSITLSARNHRHGLDLVRPAVGFEITSARHPRAQHMVDLWGDVRCSPKWETVNCGGC